MSIKGKNTVDIRKMTYLAILTAIVFVLQFISLFLRFSAFSLTFVLVPIVIGVSICGIGAGAWLGFVFGLAVFATGDAALFLQFNIPATIFLVFLKGILAGLAAGLVYKLLEKKNRYLAIICSAVAAPVVNTGTFFLGCELFFFKDIAAEFALKAEEVTLFIITGFIGINFFVELAVNLILAPTIYKLIEINKKN